jgi:Flp pilus assembly protein TadD
MLTFDDLESVFSASTFAQHYGFTRAHAKDLADKACDLLEAGAFDDAAVMFEGLVVMNHHDPGNWTSLGIAYAEAHRIADARAALQTALRLQPGQPIATKYLGKIQGR